MFDKFKAAMDAVGKAKELRARMESAQAELARKRVTGEAGGGAVRVEMSGKLEVLSVHVDRAIIAALAGAGTNADQAMVEELLRQAFAAALERAQAVMQQEMAQATQGLDLGL